MNENPATNAKSAHHYPKLAYTLISIMLFMPVLLWPTPILLFQNPMLPDLLAPTWLLCTTFLLLYAVTTDTLLYGIKSLKQAIDASLWVTLFAAFAITAVQSQGGSWLLAMLFTLHAMRSGYRLFNQDPQDSDNKQWWLWSAWARDTAAALVLLAWSSIWTSY